MVLVCRSNYSLGHMVFSQYCHAVLDVSRNHIDADLGYQVVMRIVSVLLIFGKVLGVIYLSNVVKICARSRHIRVEVDCYRAALDKVGYVDAVVVGAGRFFFKLFHERLRRRTYLCQTEVGPHRKYALIKRKKDDEYADSQHTSDKSVQQRVAYRLKTYLVTEYRIKTCKRRCGNTYYDSAPSKSQS